MRILIAEDDDLTRKILVAALKSITPELHVAKDGNEAAEFYRNFAPNLVVSDMEMPGKNGFDLCRFIRAQNNSEYTYFIMLTGHSGPGFFQQAMEAGVDDFLSKPLDTDALHARLHVARRILNFHRQFNDLKELVPICMYCKKVREDAGYWQKLETYMQHRIGADVSHSVCPDCYTAQLQPQLDELKKESRRARDE